MSNVDAYNYAPSGLIITPESDESNLTDVIIDMLTVETGQYSGESNNDDARLINRMAVDLVRGNLPLDVYCDAVRDVVQVDPYWLLDAEIIVG